MISNLHLKPENISIGGDSAGANLAIGVLSHLMHPHKDITPLELEGGVRLGAAILLAPWCTFRMDYPSRTYNENKDLVPPAAGDRWSESFLGGKDRDAYNEPLSAPEDWWNGLEGMVREILICGGADEILVDPIRELGEKYKVCGGLVVEKKERADHSLPRLCTRTLRSLSLKVNGMICPLWTLWEVAGSRLLP